MPRLSDALGEFYLCHFQPEAGEGTDDTAEAFSDRYSELAARVRTAKCERYTDILEKLRAFELLFFEDGGDYTDGRELAWLGAIKADILALWTQQEAVASGPPAQEPVINVHGMRSS